MGTEPVKINIEPLGLENIDYLLDDIDRKKVSQINIITKLVEDKENAFERIVEKALELKGFVFNNKLELYDFVKNNCRVEEHVAFPGEKIYYVNETPFLRTVTPELEVKYETKNNSMFVSADLFTYQFL